MKNLFNNLFFSYFPYGWRRLFRTIMFGWFVFCFIGGYQLQGKERYESFWDNTGLRWFMLGTIGLMLLSYIITGFIKQKKSNL